MMKYRNLTPHTVRSYSNDDILGELITEYQPEPIRAEAEQIETAVACDNGIPFCTISYGEITGLPEQEPGVLLIVSIIIMLHPETQSRNDLISPDGGPSALRKDGQVFACRRFKCRDGVADLVNASR